MLDTVLYFARIEHTQVVWVRDQQLVPTKILMDDKLCFCLSEFGKDGFRELKLCASLVSQTQFPLDWTLHFCKWFSTICGQLIHGSGSD